MSRNSSSSEGSEINVQRTSAEGGGSGRTNNPWRSVPMQAFGLHAPQRSSSEAAALPVSNSCETFPSTSSSPKSGPSRTGASGIVVSAGASGTNEAPFPRCKSSKKLECLKGTRYGRSSDGSYKVVICEDCYRHASGVISQQPTSSTGNHPTSPRVYEDTSECFPTCCCLCCIWLYAVAYFFHKFENKVKEYKTRKQRSNSKRN